MTLDEIINDDKHKFITKEQAIENLLTGVIARLAVVSRMTTDNGAKDSIEYERDELCRIRHSYYTHHIARPSRIIVRENDGLPEIILEK